MALQADATHTARKRRTIQPGDLRGRKWIEGVGPDDSPLDAARVSLEARLSAVQHFLPLAARHAEDDIEYVHELRVSTRRAMAALRMFKPMLPRKHRRFLMRELRRTRDAAGTARDLDVMLARRAEDSSEQGRRFVKRLRKRRRKAQQPIVAQWKRLTKRGRLARHQRKLLSRARLRKRDRGLRFAEWSAIRIRGPLEDFLAANPTDPTDLARLHRFRIRGKRLRYAMELLAPAFPPAFREELYPRVVELQDQLGEINDHAVELRRIRAWIDDDRSGAKAEYLRDLSRVERRKLAEALDAFRRRWDREEQERFWRAFTEVVETAS